MYFYGLTDTRLPILDPAAEERNEYQGDIEEIVAADGNMDDGQGKNSLFMCNIFLL